MSTSQPPPTTFRKPDSHIRFTLRRYGLAAAWLCLVAARLRPQAVRAASRSACQGAAHAQRMRRAGRTLHSLSHGRCGQRHAVTAFRETRQPRHVAARLRPQAVRAASRSACQGAAHAQRMRRAGRTLNSLSHGHCGQRHAVTACRETRQPLLVAAGRAGGVLAARATAPCRKSPIFLPHSLISFARHFASVVPADRGSFVSLSELPEIPCSSPPPLLETGPAADSFISVLPKPRLAGYFPRVALPTAS